MEGTAICQPTAGTARVVITPPVGIALTGFAGRPPSTGVHDDLTATALVLCERGRGGDDPAGRVALLALDLLGLPGETLVPQIKGRITEATGIAPERIFLNCSHTHYGPVLGEERDGGASPEAVAYREALPHHLAGVVAMADAARRPVTLAVGRGAVRVGINRRERRPDGQIILGQHAEGALDSEVLVWRFDAADGPEVDPGAPVGWVRRAPEPVAVVVNYACHAVSLGSRMRLISADFPGVMREVVERLAGGTALFIQGAAGNINPALGLRAALGEDPWAVPRRLGHALGAEAARVDRAAGGGPAPARGAGGGRSPADAAGVGGGGAGEGGGAGGRARSPGAGRGQRRRALVEPDGAAPRQARAGGPGRGRAPAAGACRAGRAAPG
jgi:hypothetical protein